ncbi:MAG TPA: DUF480 domain-containing protein [Pirellulales bacterium]|jgi:hypothetical protein|nr:DUF480 domain-containing protein [Pirellulales bacterium]
MWKPLSAIDRRVAGVLVEKAKTTPEQYPLTVNAIVTGANQKSNRYPQMELDADDVAESLDRLRSLGAVTEVQGNGRTLKYRHMMYEWLGVEKVELSVMAELLLRGAQTEGELRGRAARMDPIADLAALRPILNALTAKGLIQSLTPQGRGHVLTHALYQPQESEKLRRDFAGHTAAASQSGEPVVIRPTAHDAAAAPSPADTPRAPTQGGPIERPAATHPAAAVAEAAEAVGREIAALRAEVAQLRRDLEELAERQRRNEDDLHEMKNALGG